MMLKSCSGNCPSQMCLVKFQDDVTLHFLTTVKTSWECLDMGELKRWMTKLVKKISNGQYLYGGPEIDSDQSGSDVLYNYIGYPN